MARFRAATSGTALVDALHSGKPHEPGHAARALARRECRAASRALSQHHDLHAGVHKARKALRRLRALLALVERRFEAVPPIDRKLQKLCDGLSALRDAHVVVLTAESFSAEDAPSWEPVIEFLILRRDRLTEDLTGRDPGFRRRLAAVERAANALEALEWRRLRPKDLRAGLARSRARAAKAERRARDDPSPENLHRVRRRLRRLRMQRDALRKLAPGIAGPATEAVGTDIKALRRRIDRLGRQQDLQVLYRAVRRAPDIPDRAALLARLRKEIRHRTPATP